LAVGKTVGRVMSQSFKDLTVYEKCFSLAMETFQISKGFPKEEIHALTGQINHQGLFVRI